MAQLVLLISDHSCPHKHVEETLSCFPDQFQLLTYQGKAEELEIESDKNPNVILLCEAEIDKAFQYIPFLKKNLHTRFIPVILIVDKWDSVKLTKAIASGVADIILNQDIEQALIFRINLTISKSNSILKYKSLVKDHKQLEQLSHIASKTSNSIAIISPIGKIIWINQGFIDMYEYPLNEFKQKFEATIFHPSYNINFKKVLTKNYSNVNNVTYETYWKTKSGKGKWIQTSLTPIFSEKSQRIVRVIAIETDITENKENEARLEEQNDYLLKVTKRLETTNEILETQQIEIQREREKADNLLLNILPYTVAKQLKSKGESKLKSYKLVSVMFADFKGFTQLSTLLSNQDLIKELSHYFDIFDDIIDKHFLEKIKTIGDAYMCAGGLPLSNRSNPINIVLASLEMQAYVEKRKKELIQNNVPLWEIRLGIHTGELIAGVIGKKKFAYDIWGDTVNTAARMQSSGDVGRVNISGSTYEYIKDYFDCTYRGQIEVKNKGDMEMYFVNRLKPEYSSDAYGIFPNEKFLKILATY